MRFRLLLLLLAFSSATASAQSERNLVYATEESVTGLEVKGTLVSDRYAVVVANTVSVSEKYKGRPISVITYALDCRARAVADLLFAFNLSLTSHEEPKWAYSKPDWVPEGDINIVGAKYTPLQEYISGSLALLSAEERAQLPKPHHAAVILDAGCAIAADPPRAKEIARRFAETGGISDAKELTCRFGREGPKFRWTIRFSDSAGAVQANGRWLGAGSSVTPRRVSLEMPSIGFRASIDRSTGELDGTMEGRSAYSGQCELATSAPPKF